MVIAQVSFQNVPFVCYQVSLFVEQDLIFYPLRISQGVTSLRSNSLDDWEDQLNWGWVVITLIICLICISICYNVQFV